MRIEVPAKVAFRNKKTVTFIFFPKINWNKLKVWPTDLQDKLIITVFVWPIFIAPIVHSKLHYYLIIVSAHVGAVFNKSRIWLFVFRRQQLAVNSSNECCLFLRWREKKKTRESFFNFVINAFPVLLRWISVGHDLLFLIVLKCCKLRHFLYFLFYILLL